MEFLQTNKNIKIRRMYLQDLDTVMKIEPEAFGTHHWTRNNFVTELNNDLSTYAVAEFDGKVVAYGGVWIILDEMHIVTIGVDPKYRRKGIAESIIASFIDLAIRRKVQGITLEVRLSNIPAQRLYEKYGFQRQGTRKRYYEDNHEDALLLWTENIQTDFYARLLETNLARLASLSGSA